MDAERLRELAHDCELQAAQSGEHIDWESLPPEIRHAVQQEVWQGIAFVLREVAEAESPDREKAA